MLYPYQPSVQPSVSTIRLSQILNISIFFSFSETSGFTANILRHLPQVPQQECASKTAE